MGGVVLPRFRVIAEGAGQMSVIDFLGKADLDAGLDQARRAWPEWAAADPRLAGPPDLNGLRSWLRAADCADADRVLRALVERGSPSGGDDSAAVWVVVWALLPGAFAINRNVSIRDFDATLASQLWLEVRAFPWQRLEKVAANVLRNTRTVVWRGGQLTRVAQTTREEQLTPGTAEVLDHPVEPAQVSEEVELREVLEWARDSRIIATDDARLLLNLVSCAHTAERSGQPLVARSAQGLLHMGALTAVATDLGVSPATVRRRARRSINALSRAARAGHFQAA